MKKNILSITALLAGAVAFGQVGINTTTPAATMDITAKTPTGNTVTTNEGLLVPRVDRLRAASMSTPATSTIIYVNDISTGAASGTTANVDAVGFYYFNGTVWTKMGSGASAAVTANNGLMQTSGNIQLGGALTQATTVSGLSATNTLTFTGSGVNAFSVDGSTLSVDASNNRVGLSNAAPAATLDVTAGAATGTTTAVDGILIPRVTRQRAQSMTSVPVSTLVYITEATTGTQANSTQFVDAAGFYYSDGTNWLKMGASGTAAPLNVTPELDQDYTALPTDDIILFSTTQARYVTLPSSGIPVGKKYYFSTMGPGGLSFSISQIRNNSYNYINAGTSAILMYLGGGKWDIMSGY